MADPAPDAARRQTPLERQIEMIARNVRAEALEGDRGLTVGAFVSALGQKSHATIILVFSVLNMIPGPPGYGGTIAAAIILVTAAMLLGRPLTIGGWIGERRLPQPLVDRMLDRLRFLSRLTARFSRPRLLLLTGQRARIPTGIFIILVSAPMMLPIPFINAVPNVGIAIMCLSRINRDGVGFLIGVAVSLLGLGVAAGAIWGAVSLIRIVVAG